MPTLTDPSASPQPVPQLIAGGLRMPAERQGGMNVGHGMREFGHDVVEGADKIYHAQKIEEDRFNTLRAEDAFTQLRQKQLDLTYGDDGYTKLKGADLVTRPAFDEYVKRYDDATNDIAGTLSNDMQRQKFKQRADVSALGYKEGFLRHQAEQGNVYARQVYDGIAKTEEQNAVVNWDKPYDIGVSLERVRNGNEELAQHFHWDDTYRQAVLQQEEGKIHSAVIQQAISNGNYKYAQDWFNEHRDAIDLPTAKHLATAVENGTQKQLTNDYNSKYLANEDSLPALDGLRKDVLTDDVLADDRKNILVGRIQNRQSVLERRYEIEDNKRLRIIERGINELNSNTLAGFEPNAAQLAPWVEAAKGTELEPIAQRAVQLADATRTFRNALPIAQEQMLSNAEVAIRQDPAKFDRNVLNAWRQIHDNQRKQLEESPISFAVRQGIIEAPSPLDLTKPAEAGDALTDRFSMARSMSMSYQAPFKPLTTEEVTVLRSALEKARPDQKLNYFAGLAKGSGDDGPGYTAIMAQLAPDAPVTAIAGARAQRGDTAAAMLMLRGEEILRPSSKTDGKPDGGSLLPMPPETEMRARFDNSVREAFAGKGEQRNAHYQAAKSIYAAMSMDAGDADTKILNPNRWDAAIEQAVGTIEKYNGRRVALPHNLDYSQFRDELSDRVDQLIDKSLTDRTRRSATESSLAPAERSIVDYHNQSIASGTAGSDKNGRQITVFSNTIEIPEGPNKGKFVTVPGWFDGATHRDEGELWGKWKGEINSGKWPVYDDAKTADKRAKQVHVLMEPDSGLDPSWTARRLRDLPLESVGDGRYVFRNGDGVLSDRAGRPVVIDFNTPRPVARPDTGAAEAPAHYAP